MKLDLRQHKFAAALTGYAILALVAFFALEGTFRTAVWILLGGLAVKTCIARAARW